jgi:hypothetical protein
MDFYFNEISVTPQAKNFYAVNHWITNLLLSLKAFKPFGFNFIRVDENFYNSEIMENYTLHNWLKDSTDRTLKSLFLTYVKMPYIDSDDDFTFERYSNENYYLEHDCMTHVGGLSLAYINDSISISFISDNMWDVAMISIFSKQESRIINNSPVRHVSRPEHLLNHQKWIESLTIPNPGITEILPENKEINLRNDHGKDKLENFAKKLVNSEYVIKIINSLPYNPRKKNFINHYDENGIVEIILTNTDAGLGLVVQTTGKTKRETKYIAEILKNNFSDKY